MKKKFFINIITAVTSAVCLLGACSHAGEEAQLGASVRNLTSGNTGTSVTIDYDPSSTDFYENLQNFSYRIFNQTLAENDVENPILSPVSAYLALAMAGFGAEQNTKSEFYDVLGNDLMAVSDDLMSRYPADSDVLTLSLANSAWIDSRYHASAYWIGAVQSITDAEAFQAELSSIDTMDSMNQWVKERTNGLIDKMFEQPIDASLVLLNTLYFKGKWSKPFEPHLTYTGEFCLADGETVEVELMSMYNEHLDYLSNDVAEGVILPYQSPYDCIEEETSLAFVALKPKHGAETENWGWNGGTWELTSEVIMDLLANKQTKPVNLRLPKFSVTFDRKLNAVLQNMGLKDCFDEEKADFSKILSRVGEPESGENGNLFISLVRQKAEVTVDEEGTEAAAATEVEMKEGAMELTEEPIELFFDEPFLYMIMDMDKEIPLFIGVMENPAA